MTMINNNSNAKNKLKHCCNYQNFLTYYNLSINIVDIIVYSNIVYIVNNINCIILFT